MPCPVLNSNRAIPGLAASHYPVVEIVLGNQMASVTELLAKEMISLWSDAEKMFQSSQVSMTEPGVKGVLLAIGPRKKLRP